MTSGTLLLLTGARILDPRSGGTEASEMWAAGIMYRVADTLPPWSFWLAGRCATGPDDWVPTCAAFADRQAVVEYATDGWRYRDDVCTHRWRPTPGPCVDPHERNAAMIAAAVRARAAGWDVRVLALLCPWSRTAGARKTADRAEAAGFAVEKHVCPREYAPR